MSVKHFFHDALHTATSGRRTYHVWMACLTVAMVVGAYGYWVQLTEGLSVTGMTDHVSWGLYISNFTFLVGLAAAAVMLVMPAYVLKDVDFTKAVLVGEGVAVAALLMSLAFVTVDLGGPHRVWHLMPWLGTFNFPRSMLTWDVLVLNVYLLLNLAIPFYILYSHYMGRRPRRKFYLPLIYISVFWAVAIHLVTAFLLVGLPARPFWHSALMGPRFLASAFTAGPAFIILVLGVIRTTTGYRVKMNAIHKLSIIVTVAAQVNLIMLGSEVFKEFYQFTHHSLSARYLFFGLGEHRALVPWVWSAIGINVLATLVLMVHPWRTNPRVLYPACLVLFVGIWIEKGLGLVIPGFIPSPLGEVVEYTPTWVELVVVLGIWAMGLFIFTVLVRVAIPIELGSMRHQSVPPPEAAGPVSPIAVQEEPNVHE